MNCPKCNHEESEHQPTKPMGALGDPNPRVVACTSSAPDERMRHAENPMIQAMLAAMPPQVATIMLSTCHCVWMQDGWQELEPIRYASILRDEGRWN